MKQFLLKKKTIILAVIGVLILIIAGLVWCFVLSPDKDSKYDGKSAKAIEGIEEKVKYTEISDEEFEQLSEEKIELSQNIEAYPSYDENDTWAFYIYMCGSDLESQGRDTLTDATKVLISRDVEQIAEKTEENEYEYLKNYQRELSNNNLSLPTFLFDENFEEEISTPRVKPNLIEKGLAAENLIDISNTGKIKNVEVVVNTGGSKYWSYREVNSNRNEIYRLTEDGLVKIENNEIKNMGEKNTLEEFLRICVKDYDADHKVLVIWNHGEGAFGCAYDEVFNDSLSLKEIREALSDVFKEDTLEPPLEAIGFDCCMMANFDVAKCMSGYAKYMYASEELEPGSGWDYSTVLSSFRENKIHNGAILGKIISDSYVKKGIESRYNGKNIPMVTFSVMDLLMFNSLYEAYEELNEAMIIKSIGDCSYFAKIGEASQEAIHFGGYSAGIYKHVDLGLFAKSLKGDFEKEASKVCDLLNDCVIYQRESKVFNDATGLSVYFPYSMGDYLSFKYYLKYINEVCESNSIKSYYYYSTSGCVNDELKDYLQGLGIDNIPIVDSCGLDSIADTQVFMDDGTIEIEVDPSFGKYVQGTAVNLIYFPDENSYIDYGIDSYANLVDGNKLRIDYKGEWEAVNGFFMQTDVLDYSEGNVYYAIPITYNDEDATMFATYSEIDNKTEIIGFRYASKYDEHERAGRDMLSIDENASIRLKRDTGSLVTGMELDPDLSEPFKMSENPKVGDTMLDDGKYLLYISIIDFRGQDFQTPILEFDIVNGKLTNMRESGYAVRD